MRAFLAILLLLIALPAAGHSYRTQGVMVGHVWAAPTRGSDTEVYVPLLNTAPAADQLVSIIAPTAKLAELVDGSSRRIGAIELPPNRPVVLKPGGFRIRLIGLDKPLRVGDRIKLTLVFAKAGTVAIEAHVEVGPSHG
ncbi:MAG: copper chaperone PCu(A)C [Alphaproteobacteria bacterium]|nr:copper chaperone PCu(A)C [Alphaproteobacteria bacterium]